MGELAYRTLVYAHVLLFVLWLGADVGVFVLGQHFRKRHVYSLDQRIALLKLLVAVDMGPRTAWALMVPMSLTVATQGGLLVLPDWMVWGAWALGLGWLLLVWDAHLHDQTPRAARDRRIETWVKLAIMAFYLWLGVCVARHRRADRHAVAGVEGDAVRRDLRGRDDDRRRSSSRSGHSLMRLLREGSSDDTEMPLRRTMDRTRIWVWRYICCCWRRPGWASVEARFRLTPQSCPDKL